jgi:hypothetical protein
VRKAGLEDLERGPQATCRDPHVVNPLDVAEVEDVSRMLEDLFRPHFDHASGSQREPLVAVELHLARTCHRRRLEQPGGRRPA